MTLTRNPYRVLHVRRDADRSTIRAAYRALAWRWHPDRGGASEQMIQINEARRILGHPGRRAAFDAGAVTAPTTQSSPTPDSVRAEAHVVQHQPRPASDPGVLDYGRYAGWSIARLADHDPDFLEWLLRMPAGRPYAAQIREVLARREQRIANLAAPRPQPRRSFFGMRPAGAR